MLPWKGRWALVLAALFSSHALSQERIQLCAACHGASGNSINPHVPSIAGQPKLFLENQLILFREELRRSEQMLPIVRGMKDAEIIQLAEHFSKLPAKGMESGSADRSLVQRGALRAKELRCGICHLADFSGQNQIPRLAGQHYDYLVKTLNDYKTGERKNPIMAPQAANLSKRDMEDLAAFYSKQRGLIVKY